MIPQAFTVRDTTEAYKWLMTLPQSVRDEMKSMEQVVSLYLRNKRLGGGVPTPEELKASGTSHSSQQSSVSSTPGLSPSTLAATSISGTKDPAKDLSSDLNQVDFIPAEQNPMPAPASGPFSQASFGSVDEGNLVAKLDLKSRQIISDVKESLNLSSDLEVIRMSLIIAYKSFRDLIR